MESIISNLLMLAHTNRMVEWSELSLEWFVCTVYSGYLLHIDTPVTNEWPTGQNGNLINWITAVLVTDAAAADVVVLFSLFYKRSSVCVCLQKDTSTKYRLSFCWFCCGMFTIHDIQWSNDRANELNIRGKKIFKATSLIWHIIMIFKHTYTHARRIFYIANNPSLAACLWNFIFYSIFDSDCLSRTFVLDARVHLINMEFDFNEKKKTNWGKK